MANDKKETPINTGLLTVMGVGAWLLYQAFLNPATQAVTQQVVQRCCGK